MLNLYIKAACPYCQRVLKANQTIKAPLNLIDITGDEGLREELIAKGGKKQVPYLEDASRMTAMYESLAIIDYLAAHYGSGAVRE